MASFFVVGLICANLNTSTIQQGTMLSFQGTMVAAKGDSVDTRKAFQLNLVVSDLNDLGAVLDWSIKEQGRGGWPWPTRFGRLKVDSKWRSDADGPSLLYQRDDGLSVVPLVTPMLQAQGPLTRDSSWTEGKLEYAVVGPERLADRATWKVAVTTPYGRNRKLWVDKESPVVIAMEQTVFIGQGEQYQLKLALTATKVINTPEFADFLNARTALFELRNELNIGDRSKSVVWNGDQISVLKERLPGVKRFAEGGPLSDIVREAEADTKNQKNRTNSIAAIRKQIIGKQTPQFQMESLSGDKVKQESLNGSTVILHFWQYRDKPLEEPYGQVGYLDFLNRNYDSKKLKVFGVMVDERLAEVDTRQKAITSAKKLHSFMNLSYPILLDSGGVIKSFGDPRLAGSKLPLYVVLGADGKVLHYHAGLYEVDRDQGLKELKAVIKRASKTDE